MAQKGGRIYSEKNDEKQGMFRENVRNETMYVMMRSAVYLAVLFLLFGKVMPVFQKVCIRLGTAIPLFFSAAIRLAGIFSGGALILLFLVIIFVVAVMAGFGTRRGVFRIKKIKKMVQCHSRIFSVAVRWWFMSVIVLITCEMETESGVKSVEKINEISKDCDCQVENVVHNLMAGVEAVVEAAVVSAAGLVFLSVMFPLADVMSEIGACIWRE